MDIQNPNYSTGYMGTVTNCYGAADMQLASVPGQDLMLLTHTALQLYQNNFRIRSKRTKLTEIKH